MPELVLPSAVLWQMCDHCLCHHPEEACGLLAGQADEVRHVYCLENADHSATSYSIGTDDLIATIGDIERQGWDMLAIFHSHPHSPPYPSETDVRLAYWPDAYYIIVSLASLIVDVRAYRIIDGRIIDIPLRIAVPGS